MENERAREMSEADVLDSNDQSHLIPWTKISRTRCTCTCHHNSLTLCQFQDMSMGCSSAISDVNAVDNSTISSNERQSVQSAGDPSVIDVSLWRDVRTGTLDL